MRRHGKALLVAVLVIAVISWFFGYLAASKTAKKDTAPSINEEELQGFFPSDSPPQGVPSGTVTYELYDSAAHMRYWVFRWPDGGGYSVVPRLMESEYGVLVPYEPPRDEVRTYD